MSKAPKLRFPEFEGEWEEKELENILEYERPDNYIVSDTNYSKVGIPVLTANKSFILGYTEENEGVFKDIPVIIFDDFTTDKKYVDFPFKVKSSAIKILKTKKDSLKFIYEAMSLIDFEATEHKRYYISSYQKIPLHIPSIAEQQKIADCLSALDEEIAAEEEALEALKTYKKGLLQQLFPEGVSKSTPPPLIFNKLPKLRFEGFEGEWEEVKLGEICNITNGKANVQDHIEGGRYPLFDRSEVVKASNEYFLDCETVILPDEGVRFTPKYYKGKFNLHQRAYALKDFSCSGLFLYYAIYAKKDLLATKAVQSTVLSLRLPILQNFEICIPVDIAEQEKIANCLSSLDELIEAKNEKIKLLKSYKKGLLQQMFVN